MSGNVFVDTNVLVYSRDSGEPAKQPRAEAWRKALWETRAGRTSVQVLQEYYVTLTRKLVPGMPREQARAEIDDLFMWEPVQITPDLLQAAWKTEERFKLSFWDALIVAAAHASGCSHLLTEDLQSGGRYDGVQVVNPFDVAPRALLDL